MHRPLTVLTRQTSQAVHAINQSIFLRCLWLGIILCVVKMPKEPRQEERYKLRQSYQPLIRAAYRQWRSFLCSTIKYLRGQTYLLFSFWYQLYKSFLVLVPKVASLDKAAFTLAKFVTKMSARGGVLALVFLLRHKIQPYYGAKASTADRCRCKLRQCKQAFI